jgi:hypothetical protein
VSAKDSGVGNVRRLSTLASESSLESAMAGSFVANKLVGSARAGLPERAPT